MDIIKRSDAVFANTYGRYPVVMEKGSGCILYDIEGREYLDFVSGIAVCSLGHCHPEVTAAICDQAGRLLHVSNLYYTLPQTELAEMLVANSFADKVFMANSGAEVNEAAIKLARKYGGPHRYEIVSLEGSFHGRTLATVAATGQPKFHQGFEPLPAGFKHAPLGDLEAVKGMINDQTCAILCEPLQGEGGVRPLAQEFFQGLRDLCDQHDLALILDEVQVGMGRTGTLFAHEQYGVTPDILTSAKALGNGLPIGAMLATDKVAASFMPGDHASTFGGNPVASAAAVATLKIMLADGFLDDVAARGVYLAGRLHELVHKFPNLATGVRGMGLIQGLVLSETGAAQGVEMVNALLERGVLLNFAGGVALRCIPPLVVSREQIDTLIETMAEVLAGFDR